MKHIPNVITILRILLSFVLLITKPFSFEFYMVYITCGFSDIIDGYLARNLKLASDTGALLDTIADMVMVTSLFIILIPVIIMPMAITIWIAIIAMVKAVGLIIAYRKYQQIVMLHTYLNKLTGLALFIFIMVYPIIDSFIAMSLVCFIATVAAVEEVIIYTTANKLNRDKKGLIFK